MHAGITKLLGMLETNRIPTRRREGDSLAVKLLSVLDNPNPTYRGVLVRRCLSVLVDPLNFALAHNQSPSDVSILKKFKSLSSVIFKEKKALPAFGATSTGRAVS
jgi:hypothetical protein